MVGIDVGRAIKFVETYGNASEIGRLRALLGNHDAVNNVLEELKGGQREDGGFAPYWSPDMSSVDATCYHLAMYESLQLLDGIFVGDAVSFLVRHQKPNGTFEEGAHLADCAPPWAMPGDLAATLYLTANCAYWIYACKGAVPSVHRAIEFIKTHLDRGVLPSFMQTHWLSAALLGAVGEVELTQAILGYLDMRIPELDAGDLTWMVTALRELRNSYADSTVDLALQRLASLQQDDGRFQSGDGEWQDVHITLEAIRVALQFVKS